MSTGSNTLVLELPQHVSKTLCNCYLYQDELWHHSAGVGCNPCSSPGTSGYCNVWVLAGLATLAAPIKTLDWTILEEVCFSGAGRFRTLD